MTIIIIIIIMKIIIITTTTMHHKSKMEKKNGVDAEGGNELKDSLFNYYFIKSLKNK